MLGQSDLARGPYFAHVSVTVYNLFTIVIFNCIVTSCDEKSLLVSPSISDVARI